MSDRSKKKSTAKATSKNAQAPRTTTAINAAVRTVEVRHTSAPTFTRPKWIHPRRFLPFVAEGVERGVHSLSPRAMIFSRADAAQGFQVVLNTLLTQPAQNRTARNVGEPSVSVKGDVVLYKTDGVKAGRWQTLDITTKMLNMPGLFDLTVGANYIHVTANCFGPDGQTVGSAVVRIPLVVSRTALLPSRSTSILRRTRNLKKYAKRKSREG
jgi:hypothetical protein